MFTYRGSWCAEGLNTSWEAAWRIVGAKVRWFGTVPTRSAIETVDSGERDGLFDPTTPIEVPPLDPNRPHRRASRRHAGFRRSGARRPRAGNRRRTTTSRASRWCFGAIESAEAGRRVDIVI